jgi:antitoxin FitA-like protein
MPAIVLKDVPEQLHRRLREQAERNRRSMTQELLMIIETALRPLPPLAPVKPVRTRRPFTHAWLLKATREGRE